MEEIRLGKIVLSDEQVEIIHEVHSGKNVIVDSVAGSGKSTLVLGIAKANELGTYLQVTYNRRIADELKTRVVKNGIKNLTIHTYHSLCNKYYDGSTYTDTCMSNACEMSCARSELCILDTFIIDEAQDMTPLMYNFIKKIIKELRVLNPKMNLVIIGDEFQTIYGFKGADARFLTKADKLFEMEFIYKKLSISYRLTDEMSDFINGCVIGYNRIHTAKSHSKVTYLKMSTFGCHNYIATIISNLIGKENYKPEDFYVLAYSVKHPGVKKLEQSLVKKGINCYITSNDTDDKKDPDIYKNKVVMSSIHQAKGCERKVVILYGFDNYHFKFEPIGTNQDICPNILYVGITRASEKLFIIENEGNDSLKFMEPLYNNVWEICDTHRKRWDTSFDKMHVGGRFKKTVVELSSFLNGKILMEIEEIVKNSFIQVCEKQEMFPGKKVVVSDTTKTVEDISLISGVLFLLAHKCEKRDGKSFTYDYFYAQLAKMAAEKNVIGEFVRTIENIEKPRTILDYIRHSVLFHCISSSIYNPLRQLPIYEWYSQEQFNYVYNILNSLFVDLKTVRDEVPCLCKTGDYEISGRVDAHDDKNVYEFKFCNDLTTEHFVQLMIYYYIHHHLSYEGKLKNNKHKYYLVNLQNGEKWKLENTYYIEKLMTLLLTPRDVLKSDKEFYESIKMDVGKGIVQEAVIDEPLERDEGDVDIIEKFDIDTYI